MKYNYIEIWQDAKISLLVNVLRTPKYRNVLEQSEHETIKLQHLHRICQTNGKGKYSGKF